MGIADSMQAAQKEMMDNQKATMIEMAMKQRQAQMAMMTAIGKEQLKYYSTFVALLYFVLPVVAYKHRAPVAIVPLVPLSILWCWQYDQVHGNLTIRAQREAARMFNEEPERFFLPTNSGIVDQAKYNSIVGISADYQPKINQTDNVFTSLGKNLFGSK